MICTQSKNVTDVCSRYNTLCHDYQEYLIDSSTPFDQDTVLPRHISKWNEFETQYTIGNKFKYESGSFDRLYTGDRLDLDLISYGNTRLEIHVPKGVKAFHPPNTDEYRFSSNTCFEIVSKEMKTVTVNKPERTATWRYMLGLSDNRIYKDKEMTFETYTVLLSHC